MSSFISGVKTTNRPSFLGRKKMSAGALGNSQAKIIQGGVKTPREHDAHDKLTYADKPTKYGRLEIVPRYDYGTFGTEVTPQDYFLLSGTNQTPGFTPLGPLPETCEEENVVVNIRLREHGKPGPCAKQVGLPGGLRTWRPNHPFPIYWSIENQGKYDGPHLSKTKDCAHALQVTLERLPVMLLFGECAGKKGTVKKKKIKKEFKKKSVPPPKSKSKGQMRTVKSSAPVPVRSSAPSSAIKYSQAPTRTATSVHRTAPRRKQGAHMVTLEHGEPLTTITLGPEPSEFILTAIPIQPGDMAEAIYIREESKRWTWWDANWMSIIWQTYVATDSNARFHMAVSLNPSDPPPATMADMEQMEGYFSQSAWKSFSVPVDIRNMQRALKTRLIRNGPKLENTMYDGGIIYIHISGGAGSQQVGVVRTEYSINLRIARVLNSGAGNTTEPNATDTLSGNTTTLTDGDIYTYNPDQIKSMSEGVTVDGAGTFTLPTGSWHVKYRPEYSVDSAPTNYFDSEVISVIEVSADSGTAAENFSSVDRKEVNLGNTIKTVTEGIVNVAEGATRTVKAWDQFQVIVGDVLSTIQPLGNTILEIVQLPSSYKFLETLLLLQLQDVKTGKKYYRHPEVHIKKMLEPGYDPSAERILKGQGLLEKLLIEETTTTLTAEELASIKLEEMRRELVEAQPQESKLESKPPEKPTWSFDEVRVGDKDVLVRIRPGPRSPCFDRIIKVLRRQGRIIRTLGDFIAKDLVYHVLVEISDSGLGGKTPFYEGHLTLNPECPGRHPGYKPRLMDGSAMAEAIVAETGFPQADTGSRFSC